MRRDFKLIAWRIQEGCPRRKPSELQISCSSNSGMDGVSQTARNEGVSTASPQRLSAPTKKYFSHCDREYMYSKLKQEFHKKYFRQLLMMPYAYFLFYSLPFHVFNTSGNSLNCFLNPLMGSIPQLENNDPDQLPHFAEKTKLR